MLTANCAGSELPFSRFRTKKLGSSAVFFVVRRSRYGDNRCRPRQRKRPKGSIRPRLGDKRKGFAMLLANLLTDNDFAFLAANRAAPKPSTAASLPLDFKADFTS